VVGSSRGSIKSGASRSVSKFKDLNKIHMEKIREREANKEVQIEEKGKEQEIVK
jgi:hypothetical protein